MSRKQNKVVKETGVGLNLILIVKCLYNRTIRISCLKMESCYTFTAAVRGYHYYRKTWKPKENELRCLHEEGNPYDRFAIKTVTSEGTTVGHLPREISRITKFFMDRGAVVSVQLTSRHYRRSPLVQGGMEIACLVTVKIPATKKNTEIAELYIELVRERYTNPKEEDILGCFITEIEEEGVIFTVEQGENRGKNPSARLSNKSRQPPRKKQKQLDIRTIFARAANQNGRGSNGNKENGTGVIEID